MNFSELNLRQEILKSITKKGYLEPTPIQAQAIPAVLSGRDVMAAAQTGTGKTAGFTLPILEKLSYGTLARENQVRALILTPTRELAAQVHDNIRQYGDNLQLRSGVVFGGVKINPQMKALRGGVDILVATPGRLLDLYSQNTVRFKFLEILVLDEADRMLDMGFIHDIKKILKLLPTKRQNLLFSATFSVDIRNLAKGLIHNPIEISVTPRNTTVEAVNHFLYPVDKNQKTAILIKLIKDLNWEQALVFSRTKHGANKITKQLIAKGISAIAIHGNKSQGARTRALTNFKSGEIRILVATDIAARGIDIEKLPQVVNYDLPQVPEDYIHRIGRTGRAGESGEAISFVSYDEFDLLKNIERLLKQLIERKEIEGFVPTTALPQSKLDTRPFKPKKIKTSRPKNKHQNQKSFKKKTNRYNTRVKKPAKSI
ncbi:MAG: DEAD/DEAH box helicase [Bacteriovoracaceae bacterium]|jgi:ATP-dependent RNA helicase RhlE|nr:DEAD/DEAH box helicase [Bacteriovoracaceae bacterium]